MRLLLSLLIVALALSLRLPHLPGHLTLGWDQVRDLTVVNQALSSHTLPLLGPVVKGEAGGFYLGPWYYYLFMPIIYLAGSSPLSLAVISIGSDLVVILLLLFLIRQGRLERTVGLVTCLIWACSPLIIRNSYTAWNVSLIPLWSLAFVASWGRRGWLVLLASLATSIHVSLWPLSLVGLFANWRLLYGLKPREYMRLLVIGLIPLVPLIVYELTHHLENLHLLKFYLLHGRVVTQTLGDSIVAVLVKFGYTAGRLFTGEPLTGLGLGVGVLALIYGLLNSRRHFMLRACTTLSLSLLGSLIIYRDPGFAEYYLNALLLPIVLLISSLVSHIRAKLVLLLTTAIFLPLGISVAKAPPFADSLAAKQAVASAVQSLNYPVEIHYQLPDNLLVGLSYLISADDLSTTGSPRKAYFYEVGNTEQVAPEEARSIIKEQPLGLYKLVVFSN